MSIPLEIHLLVRELHGSLNSIILDFGGRPPEQPYHISSASTWGSSSSGGTTEEQQQQQMLVHNPVRLAHVIKQTIKNLAVGECIMVAP